MATRRSARIQSRQQLNSGDVSSATPYQKLWCLCRQPEGGRFMICCDRCNEWYHGDCVGITPSVGRQMETDAEEFICPTCSSPTARSCVVTANDPCSNASFYPSDPCVDFQWGDIDGATFSQLMRDTYEEVVHWRRNNFLVPSGKSGKDFVLELARLYQAYADNTSLHSVALTACSVFQALLLQKPHAKSKSKEHVACLERRLALWRCGDIAALLREGKCVQTHLQNTIRSESRPRNVARIFDRLMSVGKVSAALKLLSEDVKGGVLSLDSRIPCGHGDTLSRSVKDILVEKHPPGQVAVTESLLESGCVDALCYDPILFEQLTGDLIKWAALRTHGAAGPSGVDAYAWRRLCSSFGAASVALCNSLAAVARRLCVHDVDPTELMAFVACRLIPLDKKPGVRPIGIGDVPRRIVAKAILRVVGNDIQLAAGALQTCAGQDADSEAAIHAMRTIFENGDTDAALLVDASNAFNLVNRQAALHNISVLCPSFSTILRNTYSVPIRLFITGEGEISSTEGTTQGDPLAMAMYALAVTPLIRSLRRCQPNVSQVWFADDATAAGQLAPLLHWWRHILAKGPLYGYFPNPAKTHLIVKPDLFDSATALFQGTDIQITCHGQRHLGAAIGTRSFTEEYVSKKVKSWSEEILSLSNIAQTHPHSAYSAFVHGIIHKWNYVMRTIESVGTLLQPLEDVIHQHFIPALTGRKPCSELERNLLSLPCRLGGLNIPNPTLMSDLQFSASKKISAPLATLILQQSEEFHIPCLHSVKSEIHQMKQQLLNSTFTDVKSSLDRDLQRTIDLISVKCSSLWLTALPIQEQGFHLNKQEFRDALCLRYGWQLYNVPSHCVCGSSFSVDHAMICRHGGLTFIRHNELRDLTAGWLQEVCHDVAIEPPLQPLTGESITPASANRSEDARADVHARGFWGRRQSAFFDVRVFHPNAPSYRQTQIASLFRRHELEKKREYGDRVRNVEFASFTPLVFSTFGGLGREATIFYSRLADLLSRKHDTCYNHTLSWMRCAISFSLLRSAILSIRGSRTLKFIERPSISTELCLVESQIDFSI